MYYPWTWHASNTPSPRKSPRNFKFELEAPVPHKHCKEDSTTQQKYNGNCRTWMGLSEWYTNNTHIPGDPTLPEDMYDEFSRHTDHGPWSAPGTAPTWGEGCGANGGNPNGCGAGIMKTIL